MSRQTKYKFKDFHRAIRKIALRKGLQLNMENKSGSARRFELFEFDKDGKPKLRDFWVNHEEKYIHLRDMKKCLVPLGIMEEELVQILDES